VRFSVHAAIAVLAGCFGRPTYECSEAAQCVVGGVMGVCEPDGLCSYFDDGCPSGRRYGPYAGDEAEACVPEGAASTDDPSTGVATTSTSTPTSSEPSTSTSDEPSTGCVSECPDAGQELWSTVASELGSGRAHGIAVNGSGVAIAGEVTIEDRIAFVVVRFDADGEMTSSFEWPTSVGGPDRGLAIAALSGGALVVAGAETTVAGDERGVLFRLEDATVAWSRPVDTTDADVLAGVAVDASDRIVAVGKSGSRAIAIARDADGSEVYSRTFAPPAGGAAATLHAVAVTGGGSALLGGAVEMSATVSEAWVLRLGADGGEVLERQVDNPTGTADIAHAVATVADGGSLAGGVVGGNAWLGRFDPMGGSAFMQAVPPDGGSLRAIAIAGDGTIIAVGHEEAAGERDAWLAAYDLDGGEQWRTPAGAPGDDEALALALADGIAYVAGYRMDAIWVAAYAL
jgi:hypothetical protein